MAPGEQHPWVPGQRGSAGEGAQDREKGKSSALRPEQSAAQTVCFGVFPSIQSKIGHFSNGEQALFP